MRRFYRWDDCIERDEPTCSCTIRLPVCGVDHRRRHRIEQGQTTVVSCGCCVGVQIVSADNKPIISDLITSRSTRAEMMATIKMMHLPSHPESETILYLAVQYSSFSFLCLLYINTVFYLSCSQQCSCFC